MDNKITFGEYFNTKFLQWEQQLGRPSNFAEYVDHLNQTTGAELSYPVVMSWKAATRPPGLAGIKKLQKAFGEEIADVIDFISEDLELIKRNPLLSYMSKHWDEIPPEDQEQFAALVKRQADKARNKQTQDKPRAQQFSLQTVS